MKTNEFIVEYAGIGEDAEAMGHEHEVQLARQECYNAARDAIALHHILKDVPEQENLEDWVVEKLSQAASNLKDVIEHLESMRGEDEDGMGDIMHAFSFESAEKQYSELLGETRLDELNADRYADYEYQQQDTPRGVAAMPTSSMFVIVDRASGRKYPQKFKVRSEAERAAVKMGGFGKVKVTSEGDENTEEPVNELKLKPEFANDDDGEVVDMPARKPVVKTPGVAVTKVGADTYRVSYKGKSIECSRREVPHYKQQIMGEEPVNELDTSTMQSYLKKRKDTPTPKTVHKAVNQAQGVRSASEKIHDQLVKKTAIQGGDSRVREGDMGEAVDYDKHSFVGKIRRNHELKGKVDQTWQDAGAAQKKGDHPGAAKAFNKHVKYANLERPGTWRDVKEDDVEEGKFTHNAKTGGDTRVREGVAEGWGADAKKLGYEIKSTPTGQHAYRHSSDKVSHVGTNNKNVSWLYHPDDSGMSVKKDYNQGMDEGKFTHNAKTGAKLNPRTGAELPAKEKPVTMKQMFAAPKKPAEPKLTLNDVWRKVEHVVSQIFPDGDPIDWLMPWFAKQGIEDHKVGAILQKAAKANGYKDVYDYWDQLKQQHADDTAHDNFDPYGERMGESEQVDELSQGTLQSYVPKANRSREKATDDMRKQGGYDAKVDDKMGRRAEFTMKASNKLTQPVKENATGGGTSVGGIAAGVTGARQGKPGTGKPKELGNKVSRKQVQVGKGIY